MNTICETERKRKWNHGDSGGSQKQQLDLQDSVRGMKDPLFCEIGFNAGRSAQTVLESNESARVISFDLGGPGPESVYECMKDVYKERLNVIWGDSTQTIPKNQYLPCDVWFVDGGHTKEVAKADLKNILDHVSPNGSKIIMDDTPCNKGWCVGPTEAWAERDERIVEKGQKRDGAGRVWSLGFVSSK